MRNVIINDNEGQDALTGLRAPTRYGRPNFDQIFAQVSPTPCARPAPLQNAGPAPTHTRPFLLSLRPSSCPFALPPVPSPFLLALRPFSWPFALSPGPSPFHLALRPSSWPFALPPVLSSFLLSLRRSSCPFALPPVPSPFFRTLSPFLTPFLNPFSQPFSLNLSRWLRTTSRPTLASSSADPRSCRRRCTRAATRARPHGVAAPSSFTTRKTFDGRSGHVAPVVLRSFACWPRKSWAHGRALSPLSVSLLPTPIVQRCS